MAEGHPDFTVFVFDAIPIETGAYIRGVLLDPVRSADFPAGSRAAWVLGEPPKAVEVALTSSNTYEVPAAPPGIEFGTFLVQRSFDLKKRMLFTGVQNIVSLTVEPAPTSLGPPYLLSTRPGLSAVRFQAEVELLIERCFDSPDFQAYASYVLEFGRAGYSIDSMNQAKNQVYTDLISLSESSSIAQGICLAAFIQREGRDAACTLVLREPMGNRRFRCDLYGFNGDTFYPGDRLRRVIRWRDGEKWNERSAELAHVRSCAAMP